MANEWKRLGEHYMKSETGQLYQIELVNSDTHVGYAMDYGFESPDGEIILKGAEYTSIVKFRELDSIEDANKKPSKEFKFYLHEGKESTFNYLSGEEVNIPEDDARALMYAFYEVTLQCKYIDGELYVTHFEGVELPEPKKVYKVGDE